MGAAGASGGATFRLAAAACQVSWAAPAGGSWEVARNWSTGHVPSATQSVCITTPTSAPVTIIQSSAAAGSLTVGGAAGAVLEVAGSTLRLGKPSVVAPSGTLLLDGGTVVLSAGAVLRNSGLIANEAGSRIEALGRAQLENAGRLACVAGGILLQGSIVNEALGVISAGADDGSCTIGLGAHATLANRGTISVAPTGALYVPSVTSSSGSSVTSSSGSASIDNTGTVDMPEPSRCRPAAPPSRRGGPRAARRSSSTRRRFAWKARAPRPSPSPAERRRLRATSPPARPSSSAAPSPPPPR